MLLKLVVSLCASMYSKTNTLMIRLKFFMDVTSKFCLLSSVVCHCVGNGVVIKCRIGTSLKTKLKMSEFVHICDV